tara:strand:+ start:158 stop:1069 length:912 start_codon:yes stop_codon:yes gene_type:complete
MSILLTGATGFIGNRLCKALGNQGKEIRAISRYPNTNFSDLYVCDISRKNLPMSAFKGVTSVFHLASYAHDLSNPVGKEGLYKRVNTEATVNLANLSIKAGVKKFIYVSSTKAGSPNVTDLSISSIPEKPQGIYGKSKRKAEKELLKLSKDSDMKVVIVRPSLVYGPNVKGNLSTMINGIKQGWFPPLPDAGNSRSMIHVDDLVLALILIEKDVGNFGEIYIATDSNCYSSREIYICLCKAAGRKVPKWEVPIILFKLLSSISSGMKNKIEKLLGNEFYSNKKLETLGFRPQLTLRQINETLF